MTIDALLGRLQAAADRFGGDIEVRVAFQPSYPMSGTIAAVTGDAAQGVLWLAIVAPPQPESPYAPHSAWGDAL